MNRKTSSYRPKHSGYVSDFEAYLNSYKAAHPEVEEDQMRGWYIWWDHRVDFDELDKQRQDSVPVKPYYYT